MTMLIEVFTANKCWFWHKWVTDKETGFTKYQRCTKCDSKRIVSNNKDYQPIDLDYLDFDMYNKKEIN